MNVKEVLQTDELTLFQKRCLNVKDFLGRDKKIMDYDLLARETRKIIADAKDIQELKNLCIERLPNSQITAEFIKELGEEKQHLLKHKENYTLVFQAISDVGSVKIGSGTLSIKLKNGTGDGETTVIVTDEGTFNSHLLDFDTEVSGEFDIYNYDCGDEVVVTIRGRYLVYNKQGVVVFSKIKREV